MRGVQPSRGAAVRRHARGAAVEGCRRTSCARCHAQDVMLRRGVQTSGCGVQTADVMRGVQTSCARCHAQDVRLGVQTSDVMQGVQTADVEGCRRQAAPMPGVQGMPSTDPADRACPAGSMARVPQADCPCPCPGPLWPARMARQAHLHLLPPYLLTPAFAGQRCMLDPAAAQPPPPPPDRPLPR